jgi:hypothetical protein
MAMCYSILLVLLCVLAQGKRHFILCALEGMQSSPQCSVDTTFWPTPLTTTEPDSQTSGPVFTEESSNSLDLRYFGLFALVFVIYVLYVLYLHIIRSLSWANASIHAFTQLAAFYRGAATGDAQLDITCCPHVYSLCIKTNVTPRSFRPASPTGGAAEDEETPL